MATTDCLEYNSPMSQQESDWPGMYAAYLSEKMGFPQTMVRESMRKLNLVRLECRTELDNMKNFVAQLKPKSPFRVYGGPVETIQPTEYYCHSQSVATLVKAIRMLSEFSGYGFAADRTHIILAASPIAPVLDVSQYEAVIRSRDVTYIPEDDIRVLLYQAAAQVLHRARLNSLDQVETTFLLAEGFNEVVGNSIYPEFI